MAYADAASSDYQPTAETSVRHRNNTSLSLLPSVTIAPSACAHRHYGGQQLASGRADEETRGSLTLLTHMVRDSSTNSSPLICPDAGQSGGEGGRPCLMYRIPSPAPPRYALICPDGKWADSMRGSHGFMVVNGNLEG